MNKISKKIIIEGEMIHSVGYRPFLLARALRLRIPNFDAENIKENGMKKLVVSVIGEEGQISEFENFAKDNKPENAKVSKVTIEEGISGVMKIEEYRKLFNSEQLNKIVQGGLQISDKIAALRNDTNQNFGKMDDNFKDLDRKYELIPKGMFAVADEIKETNKVFEKRIEKTEKNIEELLKILVEKK